MGKCDGLFYRIKQGIRTQASIIDGDKIVDSIMQNYIIYLEV